MKHKKMGSKGPDISVVGYGTWEAGGNHWGAGVADDDIIRAMHAGFDAGINWVDTAEVYGDGRSEEIVGKAIAGRDVYVFTKVATEASGLDRDGVRRGAEGSLKRLGVDVLDLFQVHWPPYDVEVEETWEAMAALVDDGLVRYIGVSNFERDLIERCEKIRHVDCLQPHFSLLNTYGRDDLFPFCLDNGTGVIAYGPLAFGLLTGAIEENTTFADDDWRSGGLGIGYYDHFFAPGIFERRLATVEKLKGVADKLGIKLAQLALGWVFHQPGVTGAIAGSRSLDHVVENAEAGSIELSDADLAEIDTILQSKG